MQKQIIKEFNELVVDAYLSYSVDLPCRGDMVTESKFNDYPAIKNCFPDMYASNKIKPPTELVLDTDVDNPHLQYKKSATTMSILERVTPSIHALCKDIYKSVDMLCEDGVLTDIVQTLTFADLARYALWAYKCSIDDQFDREDDTKYGTVTFTLPDMSISLRSALNELGLYEIIGSVVAVDKMISEPYEDIVRSHADMQLLEESSDESSGDSSDYVESVLAYGRPTLKRKVMHHDLYLDQIWYKGTYGHDTVSSIDTTDSECDQVVRKVRR
jgi:hypothetical protein